VRGALGHGGGGRKPGHRCAQATAPATYHGGVPWHRATEATGFQRLSWSFLFLEKVRGKPLLPLPVPGTPVRRPDALLGTGGMAGGHVTGFGSKPSRWAVPSQRRNTLGCPDERQVSFALKGPASASVCWRRKDREPNPGNGSTGFPQTFSKKEKTPAESPETRCRRWPCQERRRGMLPVRSPDRIGGPASGLRLRVLVASTQGMRGRPPPRQPPGPGSRLPQGRTNRPISRSSALI